MTIPLHAQCKTYKNMTKCTLRKGHNGPHIATGAMDAVIQTWVDAPVVCRKLTEYI